MLKKNMGCDRRRKTAQSEAGVVALPDPDGALASTVDQHWDYSQHEATRGAKRHNKQT